ncbi:MAG: lipocalin family protein [Candidatus Sumerlaeia bacterium]
MLLCGCARGPGLPPPPVELYVDLDRYAGHWYEIARYPNRFERGCVGVTADYTLREDGRLTVVNQCWKGSFSGKRRRVRGLARVVDTESNSRLKVSFFRPFWGDYWIVMLDPDYQWAVVSDPNRKYLWILSRHKTMDDALFARITTQLRQWSFEPARLERTAHTFELIY